MYRRAIAGTFHPIMSMSDRTSMCLASSVATVCLMLWKEMQSRLVRSLFKLSLLTAVLNEDGASCTFFLLRQGRLVPLQNEEVVWMIAGCVEMWSLG